MYQLYTIPGSCSMGIHVLLNALDLPFELFQRDQVDNYQVLVPTNQVPALASGDTMITEGAAIALYLLNQHGDKALTQQPEFLRWLMFNYATLHPAYGKMFALNSMISDGETKQQLMQQFGDKVAALWRVVDEHLQGRTYMYGDTPTVIDYLLAVYVRWGNMFSATQIPVGSRVLALVDRVVVLPEFQLALKHEAIEYQIPTNALAA